ncbi:MAG: glutamate--tRNA ligase [Magnetococcales bacterium]|nr:glutamate--tRNA ligase [Magnetococcales bacterium]
MTLRTRFAPSPTGFLHIGGARTALFCHLHTRHYGGTTILRIEDTDRERSKSEAVEAILAGMHWLGLDPDEGPYFQSSHCEKHLEIAEQLLIGERAYRCYCTKEELDEMRDKQRAAGLKPRYDGRCRNRSEPPQEGAPFVIRFLRPTTGEVVWEDKIQGEVRVRNDELDDLILVRSDGSPTYNLSVVVDDHDMGINLVIRGEDHLSNTPRQIQLFEALAWDVPEYAHMPLLHGSDGAKLSKRHGAVSVLSFREEGFLPSAVNNYLVRLGWSHGDQEIFTMQEMESLFDICEVGRSAAIFNNDKLLWINSHHIMDSPPEELLEDLLYQLEQIGIENVDKVKLLSAVPEFQERSKTLVEMAQKMAFLFLDDIDYYEPTAAKKYMKISALPPLTELTRRLESNNEWTLESIEKVFASVLAAFEMKMGKLAQPVRVALTGTATSPGIYETLYLLGRTKSLSRLQAGVLYLEEKSQSTD